MGPAESEQEGDSSPTNSTNTSPNLTLLETGQNPGNILKAAREKLGLEISEVSSKTKINEHQVVAIESGDLDRLPPATFAKAFIKSYCKVVEVDPQPILLAFGFDGATFKPAVAASSPENVKRVVSQTNIEPTMPKNSRRLSSLSFERKSNSKKAGLIIGLAAAALFAIVYLPEFFSNSDEDTIAAPVIDEEPVAAVAPEQVVPTQVEPLAPVESSANLTEEEVAAVVEPGSPSADAQSSSSSQTEGMIQEPLPLPIDSAGEQTKANSVFPAIREEQAKAQLKQEPAKVVEPASQEPAAKSGVGEQVDQETTVSQAAPQPAGPKPFKLEPGNSALQFVFSNESWVTVRDSTNRVLLSQLNPGGERVQVQGRPPFKLIVGKAGTVRLFKDGQPVDLTPHIRGEVARLTLR